MVKKQGGANRNALTVERLVAAKEFKTLATLATTADTVASTSATTALADKADNEAALEWLLEVATTEAHWAAMSAFPARVNLPDNLTRRLKTLVKEAATNPHLYQSTALSKLLPVIHPVESRRLLARVVMSASAQESPIRAAGRAALAGSSERNDRAALLADTATAQTLTERLVRLDALGDLTTPGERASVKDALNLSRSGGFSGTDIAAIGRLASRLDENWVREWFHQTWPSKVKPALGTRDLATLGKARLLSLLSEDAPAEVIQIVAAAADGLQDWDDDAAVVARAFRIASDQPAAALERFLTRGDDELGVFDRPRGL